MMVGTLALLSELVSQALYVSSNFILLKGKLQIQVTGFFLGYIFS